MKKLLKMILPQWMITVLSSIPLRLHKAKMKIAGIYFTLFVKKYQSNGITIHVPKELTDLEFRGRFPLNMYEIEESKHIEQFLPKDAKVLELGSCLGYVSCLINKRIEQPQQHIALEANPNLIHWIEKNKSTNQCSFHVEHAIISSQPTNQFYIHDLIVGGSTKRKTANAVNVNGVLIQDLEQKYNIQFDTLIMDIEGGELSFLQEFKKQISQLNRVFLEVHPFANILTEEEALECEHILEEIGFQLVLRDGFFQIWEKK